MICSIDFEFLDLDIFVDYTNTDLESFIAATCESNLFLLHHYSLNTIIYHLSSTLKTYSSSQDYLKTLLRFEVGQNFLEHEKLGDFKM